LGGPEVEAAGEDREACEQALPVRIEEVVAPLDRGAERLLALGRFARSAGEQRQPLLEPRQQLIRRQDADAGGGKLDRERQSVEPAADLCDGIVRLEAAPDGGCAL